MPIDVSVTCPHFEHRTGQYSASLLSVSLSVVGFMSAFRYDPYMTRKSWPVAWHMLIGASTGMLADLLTSSPMDSFPFKWSVLIVD
jgi:hypothetical protein